jgi:hypothetical protein
MNYFGETKQRHQSASKTFAILVGGKRSKNKTKQNKTKQNKTKQMELKMLTKVPRPILK